MSTEKQAFMEEEKKEKEEELEVKKIQKKKEKKIGSSKIYNLKLTMIEIWMWKGERGHQFFPNEDCFMEC